jgi:hypothetical protein
MMLRNVAFAFAVFLSFAFSAHAQTWTPLAHQPSFNAGTALLLTDGTVMVQEISVGLKGTGHWWKLTPDNTGSYVNGTWSQLADMPAGYAPRYYASAVLSDGRVIVEGGEDNNNLAQQYTTLGAIYDPAANTWTSITPPNGVTKIGDASSVVLSDGTFMLGTCCAPTTDWLLDASSLTWTPTGAGKADDNSEEGWTLLPNGHVLTVDTQIDTNSEIYDPSTGSWSSAGSTIALLSMTDPNNPHIIPEIGPAVLMPDGRVFATGATSNTAIYNSLNGSWSAGPVFPNGLDIADGPAALLPNGHVLADSSPGFFNNPSSFFEFDGVNLIPVANPPIASSRSSFFGRMLILPTGQILFTAESNEVEIYTAGGTYQSAWQPTITSVAGTLAAGSINNNILGTQFNGLSQGAMYGDDAQAATNYPLVRIVNNATAHVSYARTHNHSTMAVGTGPLAVSTQFDLPAGIETGPSTLRVVANGIPSNSVQVALVAPNYTGYLDHPGCDTISGWAADRNRLNTAIIVGIYNNGILLTTAQANISRPDVGAYLGDNGLHGFSITTPAALVDGTAHQLSVRFENSGTELPASPVSLTCAPRNYTGYLDHPGCDTISGWAADRSRLNTSITANIYDNGVLVTTVLANISRPDVGASLGDNGLHGFSITTPARFLDGHTHQLDVRPENSSTEIGASPASLTCSAP